MTWSQLDSRDIRIARWLLNQTEPRSTSALAAELGLTGRVVRYRLGAVESFLNESDVQLERRPGIGIWIDADEDQRTVIKAHLSSSSEAPRVYARDDREHILKADLLWAAPDPTSIGQLHETLEVSQASVRRDVQRSEAWLEQWGLAIQRKPGVGIAVVGPESLIRRALVQLTLEATAEDVLIELCGLPLESSDLVLVKVPRGIRDHLSRLPLVESARVVGDLMAGGSLGEAHELILTVYVAVTAARLRDGKGIRMVTGHHRSLADHPITNTLASIPSLFEESFGLELPELEVAGLTEYILGLSELDDAATVTDSSIGGTVDELLSVAGDRLDPALTSDLELQRNLAEHLERLSVRLRYGLPVHNPLHDEIVERYPDVHAVALDLGQIISKRMGSAVSEDEIGFITMYLSGALERYRLKPVRKAVVVCPSGMATVWVLVSRIQAEFPQLSIESVSSLKRFETLHNADCDLVISTVDVAPEGGIPVVIVNPLLPQSDVRRLAALI